jgi:hypothetical protein
MAKITFFTASMPGPEAIGALQLNRVMKHLNA